MTTTRSVPEGTEPPPGEDLTARSVAMHDDPRFHDLRARLLRFVVPVSIGFLAWYLLYVLMSAYARGVMATDIVGSFNVALVFGLLQFVTTFGIAIAYSRYAGRRFDPLADELRGELESGGPAVPPARKGDEA
ncbi:DUF485 domain-containing protein [Streptomyces sp. 7-21]|jgi:uncharacterized membrane protein (DUF485 family)|uniref:DUF485 domain-containing protein n=1 Tax=Streptomyces sp. 7-21 TaxID=2802283 RepID=UPI00191D0732|nr:DUF485 domain-containing protein [Streptomyces sp. 7-21]MBL1065589.1 DUF485 domain-containing protein [Streptomyces sp. 7-21]